MALRDQNPKNLAFASKVDWSVAWIEILKGQVWGIIENGSGGGGTQNLAATLLEGNTASIPVIITDDTKTATHSTDGFITNSGTENIAINADSIVSTINSDGRETSLIFDQSTPGQYNIIIVPDDTGTLALDGDYLRLNGTTPMTAVGLDNGGFRMFNVATPEYDTDAANKAYVDTFVTGLSPKTAVRVATTGALIGTYNNGAGTFAMTATGVLAVDGVNLVIGDRVLIKNQVAQLQNGIYDVTTEGIIGVATIFTRSSDNNTDAEMVAAYTYTGSEGSTQANTGYVQSTAAPTIGTDPIVWNLFNSNAYGASTGITIEAGNLIASNLSTGVPGLGNIGQSVIGGTTANGALTIVGSISPSLRTTTAPAIVMNSVSGLGATSAINQVFEQITAIINQSSAAGAGYTTLKVSTVETSVDSGAKKLFELLAGAAGTSSKFAVANTGTMTVASGANRFAFNTREITAATDTFVIGDNEGTIFGNRATAQTFTVPTDASVAFPIGARIDIIQKGAGKITIAKPGVTINSQGGFLSIGAQYVGVTLIKEATNTWYLIGNLIA